MTAVNDARELLEGCEALIDARKYEQALSLCYQALAMDPATPRAHALAARALMGLDRHREAGLAASQAISLAPQFAYYHRLRAIALNKEALRFEGLARKKILGEAAAEAGEAVRLAPREAANYTVLAESYAWFGDGKQADRAIQEALKINPNSADNWASASFVATRARNWRAAQIAAVKALAIDPNNYTATNNLGVALRRTGKWGVGAVAFHDAARIDPRSPTARDNVESIGFQYIAYVSVFLLLPLVIIWPLFLAARIGMSRRLAKKPERLRPLARRLGMRVATSRRQQRRFAKAATRAQKMAAALPPGGWSSLHRYHPPLDAVQTVCLASIFVLVGVAMAGAGAVQAPGAAGVVTGVAIGAILVGVGGLMLRAAFKNRHAT